MSRRQYSQAVRRVLCAFQGRKSMQHTEIAQRVERSKPAVCRVLKRLHKLELIQRVQLTNHHRSLVYLPSPQGARLRDRWLDLHS